jgi:hypothetical protein
VPLCVELLTPDGEHYVVPEHRFSWKDRAGPENVTTKSEAYFFNADRWLFGELDDADASVTAELLSDELVRRFDEHGLEEVAPMLRSWAEAHPGGQWSVK